MKRWAPGVLLILCLPATAGQVDQMLPDCRYTAGYAMPAETAFNQAAVGVPIVSKTALPSFDVEWAIQISRQSKGTYLLQYLTFHTSVLHMAKVGEPGYVAPAPLVKKMPISRELATRLGNLVVTAIGAARKQESGYDVLDGTDYLFRARRAACAEVDNPPAGSQLKVLTDIFGALRHMAQTDLDQRKRDERAILHRVQSFAWHSPVVQPAQKRS